MNLLLVVLRPVHHVLNIVKFTCSFFGFQKGWNTFAFAK
jgi:hypothetical protein